MYSTDNTYVIYYRVSTAKQDKDMISQKSVLEHFIPQENVVATFQDYAKSAKTLMGREGLAKAVDLCIRGGHHLAVAKVDRLSRKTEDALKIYNMLNGRLISCDIPQMDKFTLTLYMSIADRERELISIRTKTALAYKKAHGVKLGAPDPMANLKGKSAVGNQTMHDMAKNEYFSDFDYIQRLYKETGTFSAVANELNSRGKTTRKSGKFYPQTVKRILERGEGEIDNKSLSQKLFG